jgi:hypothetical protein
VSCYTEVVEVHVVLSFFHFTTENLQPIWVEDLREVFPGSTEEAIRLSLPEGR